MENGPHSIRAEVVGANGVVHASYVARLYTMFFDPFDTPDQSKWRVRSGVWEIKDGMLRGTPSLGSAVASIEWQGENDGDLSVDFYATIQRPDSGGIAIYFNSIYEMIIGDGNTHTVRLKKRLTTLVSPPSRIGREVWSLLHNGNAERTGDGRRRA